MLFKILDKVEVKNEAYCGKQGTVVRLKPFDKKYKVTVDGIIVLVKESDLLPWRLPMSELNAE